MNIHFLGTGSAEPDPRRANTSLLIEFSNRLVLVDCSGSPGHSIQAAGFPLDSLTDVVLTHAHTDHVYALPSLIHGLWLHGGIKPGKELALHASPDVAGVARKLLDTFALTTRDNAVALHWRQLALSGSERLVLDVPEWQVNHFPVTHAGIEAIGLSFTRSDGSNIVYSGDSVVDELLVGQLQPSTDVLIQDCGGGVKDSSGHAGADGIARLVAGSDLSTLILVHLPPRAAEEELAIRAKLGEQFNGELLIPNDGDVFTAPDARSISSL